MDEYRRRVAKVLEIARAKSGLSQERLARKMGVSKTTIANREQGVVPTTLDELIRWCVCCGVAAKRYTDACVHPGLLERLTDSPTDAEKRQVLHQLVDEMSPYEVDAWCYLYYGDHGSDPVGVITEMLANLHTLLRDRVVIVNMVIKYCELCQMMHIDPDINGVHPIMDILYQARDCGEAAIGKQAGSYSINKEDVDNAKTQKRPTR